MTGDGSQVYLYLGRDGLLALTPFINLVTKGCSPILLPCITGRIAERADLAELMAEKPIPD